MVEGEVVGEVVEQEAAPTLYFEQEGGEVETEAEVVDASAAAAQI